MYNLLSSQEAFHFLVFGFFPLLQRDLQCSCFATTPLFPPLKHSSGYWPKTLSGTLHLPQNNFLIWGSRSNLACHFCGTQHILLFIDRLYAYFITLLQMAKCVLIFASKVSDSKQPFDEQLFNKHLLDPQGTGEKEHTADLAPFSSSMRKLNHVKLRRNIAFYEQDFFLHLPCNKSQFKT